MKQKISLVLSGGGARGIAHIGVIEELEKQGYEIKSIVGTSMGALVGGVYALGKMPEFKEWMFTLDKRKVFSLVDFTFSTQGLIKGDKVLNTMKDFISDENIEDLKIPFAAVAADLLHKKEIVFKKGSIYDAIRASISIPTVLTPVKTKNALLVDGGVLNNIPVTHAKRTPNDILIAVNVNAHIPLEKPSVSVIETKNSQTKYLKKIKEFQKHLIKINPLNNDDTMGYFELMSKTINLMTSRIAQLSLENNPPDLLINVSRESAGTYDFFKAEELVEIGRYSARKALK